MLLSHDCTIYKHGTVCLLKINLRAGTDHAFSADVCISKLESSLRHVLNSAELEIGSGEHYGGQSQLN